MLHFKILIKTQFFSFVTGFMRSYTEVHVKSFIKDHIIIIYSITSVSNDIIDDVIKIANFSGADGTEIR